MSATGLTHHGFLTENSRLKTTTPLLRPTHRRRSFASLRMTDSDVGYEDLDPRPSSRTIGFSASSTRSSSL
jgi:hypothetical protein